MHYRIPNVEGPFSLTHDEFYKVLDTEESKNLESKLEAITRLRTSHPHQLDVVRISRKAIQVYHSEIRKGMPPVSSAITAAIWYGREEVRRYGPDYNQERIQSE